ncbi:acyl-CoA dehydrogenase family protein [Streptomyces ipomoeae]|uniref:acyl-CoA dehydrogenase family protein n=1 Tax=Streptomyces ipomoeae TaxID=103232 RepID=UPI00114679EE|nr:acyl-CoA dehydrogenase family protein [Streptomyces ipomoeae]MDX2937932.1 acyl-CoA/acyl-ACP dehydrogenase [Streptomyces ipomoeae]TQE18308.1 acyl-CoA dehydrogenase [Streptomyces ipomoeae]
MDFTHDDEQNALRDSVRRLLSAKYPDIAVRREVVAREPGFDEKVWRQLADIGALALPFPEDAGGAGAGPVEVSVVAEELGRVLAPEPYVEAVVLAGGLVDEAGTDEQRGNLLTALSAGELLPAFAHHEPGSRWSARADSVTAVFEPGGWRLTGVKEPVVQGERAGVLIVSAMVDDRTALFLVTPDADGPTRVPYRTPDGGRAAAVRFDATPATALGDPGVDHTATIERVQDRTRIAYGHEALGIAQLALDTTVEYLRTRVQFGRPLSAFQALTHRAAEMYVALELARSTISWATVVRDAEHRGDGTVDVAAAASHAWLQLSRASRLIGQEAVQLHGGIGVTAEHGIGHCLSRLTAIERLTGDGAFHRSRLARTLLDHASNGPAQ